MNRKQFLSFAFLLTFLFSACGPAVVPTTAVPASPAWLSAALIDVRKASSFKISDFKGKVVLVENMATWCPNCLQQQKQIVTLLSQLDKRDQVVMIGLDVDLNENSAMLKTYIEKEGFNWAYAVASADIAREIGQLYGDQFLNPSATPMLIIDPTGIVHTLPFGNKSIDSLKTLIDGYLTPSS
jgi:thiol-disulfide isomerase/thioredoxin